MRLHINLDEETVAAIDDVAGPRGRSAFIRDTLREAVERERKMRSFWSAFGGAPDFMSGMDAEDIRAQRHEESRRREKKLAEHWPSG